MRSRLPSSVFYLWVLALLCLMQFVFSKSAEHFGKGKLAKAEISFLEDQLLGQRFAQQMVRAQLDDLRGQVIAQANISSDVDFIRSLRSPASVEAQMMPRVRSDLLLSEGKEAFRKGEYSSAIQSFSEIIDKFSYSFHVPEAYFLRMESLFALGETESALKEIELILNRYPESVYAGFSLVRMASVFREQSKLSQASEVLRIARREHSQYSNVLEAANEEARQIQGSSQKR